jgi:hypothetical protein
LRAPLTLVSSAALVSGLLARKGRQGPPEALEHRARLARLVRPDLRVQPAPKGRRATQARPVRQDRKALLALRARRETLEQLAPPARKVRPA